MSEASKQPEQDKKADEGEEKKEEKKEEEEVKVVELSADEEILNNIAMIGRSVVTVEPRFTIRVLRTLTATRKKLTKDVLRTVLDKAYPSGSKTGQSLITSDALQGLTEAKGGEDMQVDSGAVVEGEKGEGKVEPKSAARKYAPPMDPSTGDLVPEGTVYLCLLLIIANLDTGRVKEAGQLANETVEIITKANRRTMDPLAAKVFFYLARAYEIQGQLASLQSLLLAARQTAALRKDETLEVTVINLLLRSYLSQNQYDQADRLIAKTSFQGQVNQAQSVRWLFYAGRLRAIQLNYSKAKDYFQTAIRRAPKDEVAPGFVQAIHKFFIVVTLLTGQIPDRAMFRKPILREALAPYFQIVQAVRVGDVTAFQKAFSGHEKTFVNDSAAFLILRLRQVVIKTALRTITLAYSRISLADVCLKLHLDSEEDTEYVVAKAIKDGVVDATIDRKEGTMISRVARNVYETDEPHKAFIRRTDHCATLYVETVRAMRYPPNAHRKELDSAAETRERDRELAQMIQENDLDGDADDI